MHRTKDEFAVVLNKMVNFMPGAQDRLAEATPLYSCFSSYCKGIDCDTCFESLELSGNVNFTASTFASEHNEEMGISVALDDVAELVEVGSRRVPSGLDDVVVALYAHEKCDGLDSSCVVGEENGARGMPKNTCCSELRAN
ncbi:hypothetical protein Tco_0098816 [Tanacetum coccineum]